MTIFAFRPNWADAFTDRLEWLTNVITSRNGTPQRIQLRDIPRRSFEFTVLAARNEYQYLDTLLAACQSQDMTVPFWPDKSRLAANLASGATVVPVTTTYRDYRVGGKVVIGTDPLNCEEVEILSMTGTQITLVDSTVNAWPAGSFIVPARLARLAPSLQVTRPTAKVSTARLLFTVSDVSAVSTLAPSTLYNGVEVALRKPNRADDVTVEYQRLQEALDFGTGIVENDVQIDRPFNVRAYSYLLKDKQAIYEYRQWLHARSGQLAPFWSPTWERNFEVTQAIASGGTALTVQNQGFNLLLDGLPGRQDIALRHANGNWYFRHLNSFSASSATEEIANLSSALGIAANASDWAIASFLELVTLNADAVEIAYQTDSVATSSVAVRSAVQ